MKKIILLFICIIFISSCNNESNDNISNDNISNDNISNDNLVKKGDNVLISYKGFLENGEVFDSTYELGEPLLVKVGMGELLPGLEEELIGMSIGEKKQIKITPDKTFGLKDEKYYKVVNKTDLLDFQKIGIDIKTGSILPTEYGDYEIISIKGDDVSLYVNHPLSGKILNFDLEIVNIIK